MTCNATITYRHFTVKWHTVADVNKETEEILYSHNVRTDLNKINPMLEIKKESWKFRDDEFNISDYPEWDEMSAIDRERILEWYRMHGSSKSGGAFHMVTKKEEDQ